MERLLMLLAAAALVAAPTGLAQAEGTGQSNARAGGAAPVSPSFSDVPPCHWAAGAVAGVADKGLFVGFPPDPAYDSVNALRQVFEGWRCARTSWSLRFLTGAPDAFTSNDAPALASFTLRPTVESLSADRATLSFNLTAVIDENGTRHTLSRQGTATATHTDAGWRVAYADLANLDLPFFPH